MERTLNLNRRSFLKTAGAAAMVGTTGLLEIPRKAGAGEGKLATLIDLTKCNGCTDREKPACVSACKKIKTGRIPEPADPIPIPFPTRKVEDWSKKKEVEQPPDPLQPDLRPEGGGGCRRTEEDRIHSEKMHALRQPRLRDPLPVCREPQI